MPKFRKKPVVIEAVQWTGNNQQELAALMGVVGTCGGKVEISTLEGVLTASVGDWIIKGIRGECYPCKPDIFTATYEPECELVAEDISHKLFSDD